MRLTWATRRRADKTELYVHLCAHECLKIRVGRYFIGTFRDIRLKYISNIVVAPGNRKRLWLSRRTFSDVSQWPRPKRARDNVRIEMYTCRGVTVSTSTSSSSSSSDHPREHYYSANGSPHKCLPGRKRMYVTRHRVIESGPVSS